MTPTASTITGARGVPEADINVFSQTALEIVLQLHEGSAPRYGLTPRQFTNWKSRFIQ